jgi:hypothetical protein
MVLMKPARANQASTAPDLARILVRRQRAIRGAAALVGLLGTLAAGGSFAQSLDVITLILKDHRFAPNEVTVAAGARFRIEVQNQDSTPAEFESSDLHIEKVIVPGGKISVMAGPLKPGTYKFFDDYNPATANGTITAAERKVER